MAVNPSSPSGPTTRRAPTLVLLPGMDGTGRLFGRLKAALSTRFPSEVIAYANGKCQPYVELQSLVQERLAGIDGPVVLVAESFSGPVAVRVAAQSAENLVGVVLVATFISPPKPRWLRFLAKRFAFAVPIPRLALRTFLLDSDADHTLITEVRDAIRLAQPEVLAYRVREILSLNMDDHLPPSHVSFLYIAAKRDRLVRAKRAELERVLPGLQWAEIDAPHLVLQSKPERSATVIADFVGGIVA